MFEALAKDCLPRKKKLLEGRETENRNQIRKAKYQAKQTSTIKGQNKRKGLKGKGKAPKRVNSLNRRKRIRKGSNKSKLMKKDDVAPSRARKKKVKGIWNKQGKRNKPNKRKGSRKGSSGGSIGRTLTPDDCEYLDLSMITSRPSCTTGTKLVIKPKAGIARQYLIIEGKPIYAFWKRSTDADGRRAKFWDCENPTDITSKLVCKVVPELIETPLILSGSPSPSPSLNLHQLLLLPPRTSPRLRFLCRLEVPGTGPHEQMQC
eukprot:TRINITY_DN7701_c0_g1_i1.p1 TRINITY_DN7701_c0_g1~~TRINITY_DN7701_c0_g1_i1.p1  ORF type:complete len:262 (-),score=53.90 TRINITY_DN7701_c0_g1_i1:177-962(-)